jgi:hypothetical protein
MMIDVFNTPFEISLRVLLTLEAGDGGRETAMKIAALDFITVYGEDFGIAEANLHGENSYRFSEFTLRRKRVEDALKELVLDGMIAAYSDGDDGFTYAMSDRGSNYCDKFNNAYTDGYRIDASKARMLFANMTDRKIMGLIHKYSMSSLQRSGENG